MGQRTCCGGLSTLCSRREAKEKEKEEKVGFFLGCKKKHIKHTCLIPEERGLTSKGSRYGPLRSHVPLHLGIVAFPSLKLLHFLYFHQLNGQSRLILVLLYTSGQAYRKSWHHAGVRRASMPRGCGTLSVRARL